MPENPGWPVGGEVSAESTLNQVDQRGNRGASRWLEDEERDVEDAEDWGEVDLASFGKLSLGLGLAN